MPEIHTCHFRGHVWETIKSLHLGHVTPLHRSTASGSHCARNTHTLLEDMYGEPITDVYLGHVICLNQSVFTLFSLISMHGGSV